MALVEIEICGAKVRRMFKLFGDTRYPGDFIGAEELEKLSKRSLSGLSGSGFVEYVKKPASEAK